MACEWNILGCHLLHRLHQLAPIYLPCLVYLIASLVCTNLRPTSICCVTCSLLSERHRVPRMPFFTEAETAAGALRDDFGATLVIPEPPSPSTFSDRVILTPIKAENEVIHKTHDSTAPLPARKSQERVNVEETASDLEVEENLGRASRRLR
ncbi:hypothetical protein F4780DRAFT_752637 [Xylariomycetidae sp. FL0641]|nr:hypothetical protein F4780DRAFT_752637 [Xylariomycetidae sp. FL0641]